MRTPLPSLASLSRTGRLFGWPAAFLLALSFLLSPAMAAEFYENPYPNSDYEYRQINNVLNYRLFKPPTYNPNVSHPVVIYLHGNGERDGNFVVGDPTIGNDAQMANAGQYAFVVPQNQAIFPCFLVQAQRGSPGLNTARRQALAALPAALAQEFNIDLDRVIITGCSGGGGDTLATANNHASVFAAMVPICTVGGSVSNLANMPSWFFHAVDDGTVGVSSSRNAVNNLRSMGGRPIYTQYAGGNHWIWEHAYATPALIPWLAAQRRGMPSQNDPVVVKRLVPNQSGNFQSASSTLNLIGTIERNGSGAADPGVSAVQWYTGSYNGSTEFQNTTGPVTEWATPGIPLSGSGSTRIDVVASGTSWSRHGGVTFYSQTLNATYVPNADAVNPAAQIISPTGTGTYATPVTSINLAGTASDNVGLTSVIWKNSRGGLGAASGTTSWWANNISLKTGENVLTIEARDAAGRVGSAVLTVECTAGPPPPSAWDHTDIGAVQLPGGVSSEGDVVTVSGAGANMWGNDEQCHFAYLPGSGDCSITARILTQPNTHWASKAGLMVQHHLGANSAYVLAFLEPSRGALLLVHQTGDSWGGTTGPVSGAAAPYWLRLQRVGNTFTAFASPTGQTGTWTQVGTPQSVSMGGDVLIGLCVTSNVSNQVGHAQFDNVIVEGAPLPVTGYAAWAAAQGLHGSAVDPTLDLDGDGLNNLLEYALGMNAVSGAGGQLPAGMVQNIAGGDYLTLEFGRPKGADDILYTVQVCGDLAAGDWQNVGTSQQGSDSGPGFVGSTEDGEMRRLLFRDTVPVGDGARRFIRLKASVP